MKIYRLISIFLTYVLKQLDSYILYREFPIPEPEYEEDCCLWFYFIKFQLSSLSVAYM